MTRATGHTLVLTSRPGAQELTGDHLARASSAWAGHGDCGARWLCAQEAWETTLPGATADEALQVANTVRATLDGAFIDVNVVPADPATRRKRLLVCDMDSTIIEQECIDEMADMAGIKPQIADITERAMRGELDFEAALRERLRLLAGLEEAALARVYAERIRLMAGAATLTATMRAHGAFTALVSGGFSYFTSRVAKAAGFEANHANTLEIDQGRLTGGVVGPILGRQAKLDTLERYRRELGLDIADTLAAGDGANDLAMIKAAGLGVAYRVKPLVAAEAQASIIHGDLTGLLYLQGYTRAEFAAAQGSG
ncbi:MAG: phosphoserine phosphatase SerB [Hyphomicrobiaceae bacterium]